MNWYKPSPKRLPIRLPRRKPKKVIPSMIGKEGLVLDLLMNYTRGRDVYDHSGHGNHGTLNGPSWVSGPYGWMLSYDGDDDYVDIPPFDTFDEYTVMVLAKHHSVGDGDTDDSVSFRENNAIIMRDEGDSSLYFYHKDGGAWGSGSTSISSDVWNLWTQRWDGSTVTGWKNDSNPVSFSKDSIASPGSGTALGYWSDQEYFDGDQALVMVFDVAKPDSFIINMAHRLGVA